MAEPKSTGLQVMADISDPDIQIYYALKENQLYRINEPKPGIFIAESPEVIRLAIDAGYKPVSFLVEKEQLNDKISALMADFEVPKYIVSYDELKNITGYHMSRGMLCAMERKRPESPLDVCEGKRRIAVLENTQNPTNVGAIIRSAAALGIEAVLLTKGCADPLQRRASRVSMGCVFKIPWSYMETNFVDNALLKEMGFLRVSMALSETAVFLDKIKFKTEEKLAIILGTEGEGLYRETLLSSDYVVKIPMSNAVDSLNVAAASAVAFWEIMRE